MLAYLAIPYSHPNSNVKEQRVKEFCRIDANLSKSGVNTVSPIHKLLLIEKGYDVPTTWEFWSDYSEELMKKCDLLIVLKLDGWETSQGVHDEIELANKYNISIEYFEP